MFPNTHTHPPTHTSLTHIIVHTYYMHTLTYTHLHIHRHKENTLYAFKIHHTIRSCENKPFKFEMIEVLTNKSYKIENTILNMVMVMWSKFKIYIPI